MIIGIDDSSRSPTVGSLFIGLAACRHKSILRRLEENTNIPIIDSKILTNEQISSLAEAAINSKGRNKIYCYHRAIPPNIIDEFVLALNRNLNDLETINIVNILQEFISKHPQYRQAQIYIDNFDPTRGMFLQRVRRWARPELSLLDKAIIEHEADENYPIVSMAGIIAKYYSNLERTRLKEQFGDFGGGEPAHEKTRQFIRENPDCPIIRKSWNTYAQIHPDLASQLREKTKLLFEEFADA